MVFEEGIGLYSKKNTARKNTLLFTIPNQSKKEVLIYDVFIIFYVMTCNVNIRFWV
tara:strand:+ start:2277 stop:2444 length:168 start_codon:yes stop_codon:yes gene_type:complete